MSRLKDGFPTIVNFPGAATNFPGLTVFEKTVTPPGYSGGGPNDTTTMRNLQFRTKQPKKLITLTKLEFTAAYDTQAYTDIFEALNFNQVVEVVFPDGATLSFWGWIDEFKPNEIKEGEQPTAACVIECSNQDNNSVEQAPTLG